ncbi:hypothetical protein CWI82_04050 [Pseudidiomarina tainanensis]|jgi:hypothetical protein|uniref:UPF0250 protein SAMN04488070_0899 n=2 Tax=Pseudidiomarina TaxID=2800384 RepID=A0A1I6GLC4_9GAMM|nr:MULTISPECIES: DUF493 family protein YbeD [Pseudidiomarina]RZQ56482.1 hypothetical protein CWI82_04050 [Pseudidiomarina tainanensis]SFR42994.1 hypothetical protein SAMN04488070_0899 [Pseudidiomarina maritima]
MQKTRFDELVEFPCHFTFKVMGLAVPELPDSVVAVAQQHAPGDYLPTVKPSSKGNYHSVSIKVQVTSQQHIETLYRALADIEEVRYVL